MKMQLNVGKAVAALNRMSVKELRSRYHEAFGDETRTANKAWLVKRIAWRIQANSEGGLSDRACQRAAELANEADLRLSPPREKPSAPSAAPIAKPEPFRIGGDQRVPPPDTVLVREYKGTTLQVRVLPRGFEFEGEVFRSLTAVAKHITGTHCNGFHFFRLGKGASR